jgi:hypothetical protein
MLHRLLVCSALTVGLALTSQSGAASDHTRLRDWRAAGHKPYAPHVQKYVVVTPRAAVAVGPHGEPRAAVQYPWQQTTLTAPAYPWGWFGARSHPESTRSRGYYDDYADWTTAGDY